MLTTIGLVLAALIVGYLTGCNNTKKAQPTRANLKAFFESRLKEEIGLAIDQNGGNLDTITRAYRVLASAYTTLFNENPDGQKILGPVFYQFVHPQKKEAA